MTFALIAYAKHEPKEEAPTIYANGWEKHDLETWRKRGMDNTKDRNTKGLIKYAEGDKLLGVLYMIYGWDLTKCE